MSSDRRSVLQDGDAATGERKGATQHALSTDTDGEGASPDWIKGMVDMNNEIERIFGIDLDGDGGVGTSAALQRNLNEARRSVTLSNTNDGSGRQVLRAYA